MSQIAETKKPINPEWSAPRLTRLTNLAEAEVKKDHLAAETSS